MTIEWKLLPPDTELRVPFESGSSIVYNVRCNTCRISRGEERLPAVLGFNLRNKTAAQIVAESHEMGFGMGHNITIQELLNP